MSYNESEKTMHSLSILPKGYCFEIVRALLLLPKEQTHLCWKICKSHYNDRRVTKLRVQYLL
jgi:hypothetical protein